jgi:hypothetical protein
MDTNPDFFFKVILQSQLTDSSVEFLCWNFFGNDRFFSEKLQKDSVSLRTSTLKFDWATARTFANTSMVSFSFKASKTTLALKSFPKVSCS